MQHCAIYYRVSTEQQDFASQAQAVADWLDTLDEKPKVTLYQDFAKSGKDNSRPQYQKMLKDAYKRKFDTIVVFRLDRISRSAKEAIHTLLELEQVGVGFISITQPVLNLGLQNPFRRTMLAAFAELAEIERITIVERVKAGLSAAKDRGVILGPPQKINAEQRTKIKELRESGLSYRKIAELTGFSYGAVYQAWQLEQS